MHHDKTWDVYQNDAKPQAMGSRCNRRTNILASSISESSTMLNIGVGKGTLEHLRSQRGAKVYCLGPSKALNARLRESLGFDARARVGCSKEIPFQTNHSIAL